VGRLCDALTSVILSVNIHSTSPDTGAEAVDADGRSGSVADGADTAVLLAAVAIAPVQDTCNKFVDMVLYLFSLV